MNILEGLNPAQLEAATHIDGPLLIMAGAGSGKTKVLTCRIAYLLEQGVAPYHILAITFTNKAAAEMKERVHNIVGPRAKDIWLSTFHAFCARFLRMEIEQLDGYKRNFVIYDTSDSQALIKSCLKQLNLDDKQYTPNSIQSTISTAKNALTGPFEYARTAENFYVQKVAELYKLYQQKLRENNALDFDDLLMLSVRLLENNTDVLEKYQEKFKYILIDEYQDTNRAQYLLARMLADKSHNLCVVGDADQSIYAWRGADIRNIMDFEDDYPEAKVIVLEQNYRSTQTILDAANAVIENNLERKPKKLWTENPSGESITYYLAHDERDEAQYIADTVLKLNTVYRMSYGKVAVLYRTNAQSRVVEESFMKCGIPYTMVGGLKFYDRKEIKDILAYLRVIFNPVDTVALLRIINVPRRGIGDTTVGRLADYAASQGLTLFDVISNPELVPGLTARVKRPLEALAELIFNLIAQVNVLPVVKLLEKIMNDSGYVTELERDQTPQDEVRLENLREMLSVAQEFAG
ncbi:MAG TPA: UvrD-helicase domain-containing protein, partial [Negativicutes bacterium]